MRHLGLFEGIGGFSLAARWMGWETVAWCEINAYCQQLLAQHFPEAIGHADIKQTDFSIYANTIDLITGGDPCQPSSKAGKMLGFEDPRYLWPEMLKAIRILKARWIINENVPDTVNNGMLDRKISDLENEGYTCWPPIVIPAGAASLHKRHRVWLVAHSNEASGGNHPREVQSSTGTLKNKEQGQNRERMRVFTRSTLNEQNWLQVASTLCGGTDELPNRLDRNQAIGNAIDPYIALQIYKAIEQYEALLYNQQTEGVVTT